MPRGRPRKPPALKKLEGTYRRDRDAPAEAAQAACASAGVLFQPGTKIACPKTLRTKTGRAYWRTLTQTLVSLGVLAAADLPQLEELCLTLEKLVEIRALFSQAEPLGEHWDHLMNSFLKLSKHFDALAAKYYVSPAARSRLTLDALNVAKTAREIEREDAIGRLLDARR